MVTKFNYLYKKNYVLYIDQCYFSITDMLLVFVNNIYNIRF